MVKCEVFNCDKQVENPFEYKGKKVCRKCYEELCARVKMIERQIIWKNKKGEKQTIVGYKEEGMFIFSFEEKELLDVLKELGQKPTVKTVR